MKDLKTELKEDFAGIIANNKPVECYLVIVGYPECYASSVVGDGNNILESFANFLSINPNFLPVLELAIKAYKESQTTSHE